MRSQKIPRYHELETVSKSLQLNHQHGTIVSSMSANSGKL